MFELPWKVLVDEKNVPSKTSTSNEIVQGFQPDPSQYPARLKPLPSICDCRPKNRHAILGSVVDDERGPGLIRTGPKERTIQAACRSPA